MSVSDEIKLGVVSSRSPCLRCGSDDPLVVGGETVSEIYLYKAELRVHSNYRLEIHTVGLDPNGRLCPNCTVIVERMLKA